MTARLLTATPWDRHSRPADGLVLRPAQTTEVAALAALKREVERTTYSHLGTPEALATRLQERCSAWYLLGRLAAGDLVLVAELAGERVGLAAAGVVSQPGGAVLRLHSAYTTRRGYGVGRALTAARLDAGAALGLKRVTADVLVGALAAERRMGRLGLVRRPVTEPCPSFPGVRLSRWDGYVHTARERVLR